MPKDKKDKQLGNKIVNVLSGISSFMGHDLLELYKASLSMDDKTPQNIREKFKEELHRQAELYEFMQKRYKSAAKIKRKISGIVGAIKRVPASFFRKYSATNTNTGMGKN